MSSTAPAPTAVRKARLVARWAGLVIMALGVLGLALARPLATFLHQNYDALPKFVAERFFFDLYGINDYREALFLWAAWPAGFFLLLGGALLAVTFVPLQTQNSLFVKRLEIGIWTLVLVGTLFRLRAFLDGRSLWLDEAALALSIRNSGLTELLSENLAFGQSAPPGFLFLVWLSSQVFGLSELSLRLIPFLFGCGLVILAAPVSRQMFASNHGRLSFVAFIAFSPILIYYSNEFKQYSVDAFVTMLVLLMWLNRKRFYGRWLFGWLGLVAALLSLTAVLSLTALGAMLLVEALGRGFRLGSFQKTFRFIGGNFALWVVGGLIHAAYLIAAGSNRDSMAAWWRDNGGFPPGSGPLPTLVWALDSLAQLVWLAYLQPSRAWPGMGSGVPIVTTAIALVMVLGAFSKSSAKKLALLSIGIGIATAFAYIYPFSSRLNIYLIPMVAMLFALGVEQVGSYKRVKLRGLFGGLVLVAHVLPLVVGLFYWSKPLGNTDMRWLVEEVSLRASEGDGVFSPDEPVFDWYYEEVVGIRVLHGDD